MYARIHVVSKKNNPAKLSAVEISILENIADGLTTKEIAEGVGRREATIETYRLRILQKLDCRNSCEAVAFCLREGIIK